jgi:threonine dehydratase
LLGGSVLPGVVAPADLRLKLELLQPFGSPAFRGALHALLRALGGDSGLVASGPARRVFAALGAAQTLRLPARGFVVGAIPADLQAIATECGFDVAHFADLGSAMAAADERRRATGASRAGDASDPEWAAGVATLGLELAATLPASVERVHVVADLVDAVAAGLSAGGRPIPVVPATERAPPTLTSAVTLGLRVVADEGLDALWSACRDGRPGACVVL